MLRYGIVFAAASLLVQAKAEASFCANPSADGTCTPNNSSDVFLVDHPNFGFVWPPRLENGALWIAFVLVAYLYGFISSRFILSEDEKFHKKRKLEMENSKLAQTVVEVKRTAYKIQEYRKKCEEAEVLARKLLAEGEESQYSDAIMVARFETTMTVEGELGEEELPMIEVQEPVATDPLRIYRVLFDNINEKGLRQVSDRAINIKKYIGSPESVQKYQESFNKSYDSLHATMFARIISEMEDVAKKSVEAPDDGSQPDLSSGYKLEEVLKSAKDMKKRFFWSIFGAAFPIEKNIDSWVPAKVDIETFKALAGPKFDEAKFKELLPQEKPLAAGEGEEEHVIETVSREKLTEFGLEMSSVVERFLAVYKRSRRTLKVIKGKQGGTLGTLMYLIDAPTAKWMALYLITRACESATQPARLYATNHLIADAMKPNWRALVPRDIMCFAAFHVYDFFINDAIKAIAEARMRMAFASRVKYIIYSSVLTLDTQTLDTRGGAPGAIRLVERDSDELAGKLIYEPANVLSVLTKNLFLCAVIYNIKPSLLWIICGMTLVSTPIFWAAETIRNGFYRTTDLIGQEAGNKAGEVLRNIAGVRDSGQEIEEVDDFARSEHSRGHLDVIRSCIHGLFNVPVMYLIFCSLYCTISYIALSDVVKGELSLADYMLVTRIQGRMTGEFKFLLERVLEVIKVMVPAGRIMELLEAKSMIEKPDTDEAPNDKAKDPVPSHVDARALLKKYNGGIELELKNITFAYPAMPEYNVLRRLSFKIPAGSTVALVAERGAGKSTTFGLILRRYDPVAGELIANGVRLKDWNVHDYRRAIGVVAQKTQIFDATVRANILYGLSPDECKEYDTPEGEARLIELLKRLQVWDFVEKYPLQLDQRIGGKGVGIQGLSGGEEQRISIARALIKKPAILLLDEATSALDAENQDHVVKAIAQMQKEQGFTIIQIAHRLDTLRHSDYLFYLSRGQVVESGGCKVNEDGTWDYYCDKGAGGAIDDLLERDVKFESKAGEDGKVKKKIIAGFFRDLWDTEKGLKTDDDKSEGDLEEELHKLETSLLDVNRFHEIKIEEQKHKRAKLRWGTLKSFMRSNSHLSSQAETVWVDHDRPRQVSNVSGSDMNEAEDTFEDLLMPPVINPMMKRATSSSSASGSSDLIAQATSVPGRTQSQPGTEEEAMAGHMKVGAEAQEAPDGHDGGVVEEIHLNN